MFLHFRRNRKGWKELRASYHSWGTAWRRKLGAFHFPGCPPCPQNIRRSICTGGMSWAALLCFLPRGLRNVCFCSLYIWSSFLYPKSPIICQQVTRKAPYPNENHQENPTNASIIHPNSTHATRTSVGTSQEASLQNAGRSLLTDAFVLLQNAKPTCALQNGISN